MAAGPTSFRPASPRNPSPYSAPDQQHQAAYPMQQALQRSVTPPSPRSTSKQVEGEANARLFALLVGTLLVALLIIQPAWTGLRLALNPTYSFFVGSTWPIRLIFLSIAAALVYPLMILIFYMRAGDETKKADSIMVIMSTVVTALALGLILISFPMRESATTAFNDVSSNCWFSETVARPLAMHSNILQELRRDADCASKESVELCTGYKANAPYTDFLKHMEQNYMCAGFCYAPTLTGITDGPAPKQQGFVAKALKHLATTPGTGAATQSTPPTLFSPANFKISCDSMVAWELEWTGIDGANMVYNEGCVLLLACSLGGLVSYIASSVSSVVGRIIRRNQKQQFLAQPMGQM